MEEVVAFLLQPPEEESYGWTGRDGGLETSGTKET